MIKPPFRNDLHRPPSDPGMRRNVEGNRVAEIGTQGVRLVIGKTNPTEKKILLAQPGKSQRSSVSPKANREIVDMALKCLQNLRKLR